MKSTYPIILWLVIALTNTGPTLHADCSLTRLGLVPLCDLGSRLYRDQQGGLYPDGRNQRPAAHETAGINIAVTQVAPRNTAGQVDPVSGRVVLMSIGMSNTTQEWATRGTSNFTAQALADTSLNSQLVIVDGAQGGRDAMSWSNPDGDTWNTVMTRLETRGLTSNQVQAVWLKLAIANPNSHGGAFPGHAETLRTQLREVLTIAKQKLPHLTLVYVSSRTRAYVHDVVGANPETYAYEGGWACKWLVEDQIAGELNYNPTQGPVVAPWIAWGPYLWVDGEDPRSDGLTWLCSDVVADFYHPSPSGCGKVGTQLLSFFKTDPTARPWFLRQNVVGQPPTAEPVASVTNGSAPLEVSFEANASDPDGSATDYRWNFDDGTSSANSNPVKVFPVPGTYRVRLTVTDNDGNPVTAEQLITVTDPVTDPPPPAGHPWKKYLGMDVGNGISSDNWRETARGLHPLVIGNASITNAIIPTKLDEVLALNDWINLQDGYNYRQEAQVAAFFDAIRADGGALWRSNCVQLAQAMVDGNARNAATGHRGYWELGNEIYAGIVGQTIGAYIASNNLPYPHPGSPYNDNPTHIERFNDRGLIGYQVEYQIALALEALIAVNTAAPEGCAVQILSPCSTVSSVNSGWTQDLLDYVIIGYEVELDGFGNTFTNYAKPLASSLVGHRLGDLVDLVNVHYILGPNGTTLKTVLDAHVLPDSAVRGVWHTEEGGINAATSGRGGISAMSGFSRAMDVWLERGMTPNEARLLFYAPNSGPAGTTGDNALDVLHEFMPADTTVLARKPGLLSSDALTPETYLFENMNATKRVLFVLPADNTTVSFTNLTMQAGAWNWTNVIGTTRLWEQNVVPAANNVTITRAGDGSHYTLDFPQATFTGQNQQALVIFLTGSGAAPAPLDIVTPSPLPPCVAGFFYSVSLTATGGTPPYAWILDTGSLPAHLVVSSNGLVSGTPSATGEFDVTVRVTDSASASATKAFSITSSTTVPLAIIFNAFPAGTVGHPYAQTLRANGGTPPYTWSLAGGALPATVTLSPDGTVSGTPAAPEAASFTARVTDGLEAQRTKTYNLQILAPGTGTDGPWEELADGSQGRTTFYVSAAGEVIPAYVRTGSTNAQQPAVILVHGGGTSESGTYALGRQMTPPVPGLIAAGLVVYSIDFSAVAGSALDEHEWELGARAIESVRRLAYVDARRVAMIGQSHGGALTLRASAYEDILCAVPCAPAGIDPIAAWRFQQAGGTIAPNLQGVINSTVDLYGVPIATLAASPSAYGYRDGTDDAPLVRYPLLLVSGLNDTASPPPVMDSLTSKLATAGNYYETYYPADGPHGFVFSSPRIPETDAFATLAVAFLNRYFSLADSDGDGLPDGWELSRFGHLDQGPDDDPDGDGHSNFEEWRAGTHPVYADSVLRISSPVVSPAESLTLRFPIVPGLGHIVDHADDLPHEWSTVSEPVFDQPATGVAEWSDPDTLNEHPARMYRIRIP